MSDATIGPPSASRRIGAVSYLNSKPLIVELERFAPEATITVDLPSRLADQLAAGELDVALIPSVEFLRTPGYRIVSDACIACEGPVRSVKLFSRVPLAEIRTLSLDEGSRTSAALIRILLKERLGIVPEYEILPIGASLENCKADAVLLIGDRAMRATRAMPAVDGEVFQAVWDLGEEWAAWTGLPFVFATWVARDAAEVEHLGPILAAARDAGVARFEEIARREAPVVGLSYESCLSYFRDNLTFRLGARQREGLARFRELALRFGLIADDEIRE